MWGTRLPVAQRLLGAPVRRRAREIADFLPRMRAILVGRRITRIDLQNLVVIRYGRSVILPAEVEIAASEESHRRVGIQFQGALKLDQRLRVAMLMYQAVTEPHVSRDHRRLQANGVIIVPHGRVDLLEVLEDRAAAVVGLGGVRAKLDRIAERTESPRIVQLLDLLLAALHGLPVRRSISTALGLGRQRGHGKLLCRFGRRDRFRGGGR